MTAKWLIRPEWHGTDGKPDRITLTNDCCLAIDSIQYWLPKEYDCDGASIPWLVALFAGTGFEGSNAEAAWAHDALYLTHVCTRAQADEVMYQLKLARELAEGAKPRIARYRAWKMWAGVRSFGYFAWQNSIEDKIEIERIKVLLSLREDVEKFKSMWFSKAVV